MTLRADMIADVADIVLDTTEHAETVTYTAEGKPPASISAIIERGELLDTESMQHARAAMRAARLFVDSADVADPKEGDGFTFDSIDWLVQGRPEADGAGGLWLEVVSVKRTEIGDPQHRDG